MNNLRNKRDKIDAEIKNLTKEVRVGEQLRRELFGAVALCPRVDENFGARVLYYDMNRLFNNYKRHKENFKTSQKVMRDEIVKLNSD